MKTYVIRRKNAWQNPQELEAAAERPKQVAADGFPPGQLAASRNA